MNILSYQYRGDSMSKFLDARTSQNASTGGSIDIALLPGTPTAIGVVGLNVTGASGVIRVTFSGIAAINLPDTPPPVGSAIVLISDYNVPYPSSNELVYTLGMFSSVGGTRVGPESFYAQAFSD
jgi:hypothetical protein